MCKFFLEALDKGLYGWFWGCPNGEKCIYRHALPPGFVFKKKQDKEEKDVISIEEFLETEVSKRETSLTLIFSFEIFKSIFFVSQQHFNSLVSTATKAGTKFDKNYPGDILTVETTEGKAQ